MDFALSRGQQDWHDRAVGFARTELADDLLGRDERREFWREGWRRCARFGIQGLPIPDEYGGRGQGLPVTIAAMEGLGYGCPDNGLIFAINASLWTVAIPILLYGTEDQKRRYLPGLCDGSIVGANGASEPEAGSDIFSMTTRAERRGDGWVLERPEDLGHERAGGRPVRLLRLDRPGPGGDGDLGLPRPGRRAGVPGRPRDPQAGPPDGPDGRAGLRGLPAPGRRPARPRGAGGRGLQRLDGVGAGGDPGRTLGTMRRQLERCIEHARTRKQFGKPIGKFQAVANRIVEMKLRLETCRPLVYRIGWLKEQGKDATMEAAMAKLHVSECFVQNSLDAVQVFGASGYATETGIERDLRDSVGSLIYSGTNDIQRNIIAQQLGL